MTFQPCALRLFWHPPALEGLRRLVKSLCLRTLPRNLQETQLVLARRYPNRIYRVVRDIRRNFSIFLRMRLGNKIGHRMVSPCALLHDPQRSSSIPVCCIFHQRLQTKPSLWLLVCEAVVKITSFAFLAILPSSFLRFSRHLRKSAEFNATRFSRRESRAFERCTNTGYWGDLLQLVNARHFCAKAQPG